jgi:DNA-binding transcriptional MerR regulator
VAQGLLGKPLSYEPRTALYGYRHLLLVVVIKCLQANHIPLIKIREVLQGLSNDEMERVVDLLWSGAYKGQVAGISKLWIIFYL